MRPGDAGKSHRSCYHNTRTCLLVNHAYERSLSLSFLGASPSFHLLPSERVVSSVVNVVIAIELQLFFPRPRIFNHKLLGQCKCGPADTICVLKWVNEIQHCPRHPL